MSGMGDSAPSLAVVRGLGPLALGGRRGTPLRFPFLFCCVTYPDLPAAQNRSEYERGGVNAGWHGVALSVALPNSRTASASARKLSIRKTILCGLQSG